jgi:hypothetical protein
VRVLRERIAAHAARSATQRLGGHEVKRARRGRETNMHRATDSTSAHSGGGASSSSSSSPSSQTGSTASSPFDATEGHVCPFCGLTRELTDDFDPTAPCPRCTLADTPTTRNATKARIGPWHVRQMRNPWAPGMRWETLLALIKRGQVTKDSVVRGPTTQQLWKRASEVKGLSREFGVCYSCGEEIETQANLCGHCNRLQEPPANPNLLVETREPGNGDSASAAKPAASAAGSSAAAARGNGNATRRRGDYNDPPHLDIGATTPLATDVDDMLTVDDPEAAAEFARSVTSRAPQPRSNRPTTPAAKEPAPAGSAALASSQKKRQQASSEAPAAPPPPPAAASRPVALRPRQPGADDALLTPQELAAAFQLNFTPPTGSPSGGGAGGGAAAGRPTGRPASLPRRKRSKTSIAFVLLVLIGAGVAALMYLRPDLREEASAWSAQKYASVKEFIASRTAPTRKLPPAPVSPTPAPAPAVMAKSSPATRPSNTGRDGALAQSRQPSNAAQPATPAPTPTRPTPPAPRPDPIAIAPAPPPRTKTVVVESTAPTAPPPSAIARETSSTENIDGSITASSKTTVPPTAAASAPVEIIKIDPPATAAAAAAAAAPKPAASTGSANSKSSASQQPTKTWTNLSEAEDEARRLWRLAFDAEQNQDFVEAVSLYEQIKKLPPSVHPTGLEVRLSLARKLTK